MRIGFAAFIYTLSVTWFIQLIVLGYIVPDWSDGNGLVPGQDVERFHLVALAQADAITQQGWSAWELRPNGWGISGVMSAWYAITIPEPWALAPVQSLAYAICVMIIFHLVARLTTSSRLGVLATLPVVFLPTAAFLYAQPHRDLYVMLGLIVATYGWWLLIEGQVARGVQAIRMLLMGILCVMLGFTITWAVRDFAAEIFQGIAALMVLVALCFAVIRARYAPRLMLKGAMSVLATVLLLGAMQVFDAGNHFSSELTSTPEAVPASDVRAEGQDSWQRTYWLPSAIDDPFRRLAGAREHFIRGYSHGRTAIDTDVQYRHVSDILAHTPRAMQVALFSPFPSQWLPHPDAEPVRNVYRLIGGAEMALLYFIIPFLLYAGWCWWRRPSFWALLMPALAWVMVYAYTVPVVGALVRYRFPGYIVLVALAAAGLAQAMLHRRAARQARLDAVP